MEEHDLGPVIEAVNQIHDNLWLGDLEAAKEIAVANLAKIQHEIGILDVVQTAKDTRNNIRKLQEDAKKKGVRDKRLWVADRFCKKFEEEYEPLRNIYGILAIHLSHLKEAILPLIRARTQKTMESFADKNLEGEPIFQRTERSRYAIQSLPDRLEVRAILSKPVRSWDLRRLRERFPERNIVVEEVSREGLSNLFRVYSSNMFIRVLRQRNLVEIQIHTPTTEDVKQRVSKVIEAIVSCLNP